MAKRIPKKKPKQTVRIACEGAGTMSIDLLVKTQGGLKVLTEENFRKLRTEIDEDGFISPFALWEDPKTAQIHILDGHQRLETLNRMREDGWVIPEMPFNWVHALDLKDAKKKVLALASQYGTVDQGGLFAFLEDACVGGEEVRDRYEFADFDTSRFLKEHFPEEEPEGEEEEESGYVPPKKKGSKPEMHQGDSSEVDPKNFQDLAHTCPKCGFEFD